jgi:hypothetical protein
VIAFDPTVRELLDRPGSRGHLLGPLIRRWRSGPGRG